MLVHVVADYGPAGDLAFAEVAQRLLAALPGATVVATPVGPFDTLAAGFVVAQLALGDGPAERVIFHNVAPRRDEADPRRSNEGERFTFGETPGGALVVGPNAGHSLAFLQGETRFFYLDMPSAGSQFRSRDFLPAAVGRLVAGDRGVVGEPVPPELVPGVPAGVVAYTDGYGNLKTTLDEHPGITGSGCSFAWGPRRRRPSCPTAASRWPRVSSRSHPDPPAGRSAMVASGSSSSSSCAGAARPRASAIRRPARPS